MFFKKKKKMFGTNIEPDCTYCRYNSSDDKILCPYHKGSVCKNYEYDPLKRDPSPKPKLQEFSEEEFKI